MKMFRKDEGFTLVELMVVVLIIGILVAIAIPVFNAAKDNAETKQCFATQRTVEGQARAYEAENNNLPANTGLLVSDGYLKDTPVCKAYGAGIYQWNATSGTLTCGAAATPVANTSHGHF